MSRLPYVEAELNYLAPMAERPRYYAYEPSGRAPRSNMTPRAAPDAIRDMRPIASEIDSTAQGFALVEQRTAVRDFWDDDEVRRVYYPEAERFLAETTGASRVFIFDHLQRRRVPGLNDRSAGGPRQPATRVHVDHTARSGPQRVRDLMGEEAEELLKGRVQVINLWRPIRGPLQDAPLAVCDARTVDPADLVPSDLVYRERVGETYSVTYNPAHRMVLCAGDAARPGAAAEDRRHQDRRTGALYAAHLVHRSDHPGRRLPARKHRAADPGLPPELTLNPA